jgi:uncharacterized protein with HEPN domain
MRDDRERLLDILEAIEKIEKHAARGRDAFLQDELLQIWMVHHIQVIGEAAAAVSHKLRDRYPDVPWPDIIAMRNVLVHQYFGIDLDQVWSTISTDLRDLKKDVQTILQQPPSTSSD